MFICIGEIKQITQQALFYCIFLFIQMGNVKLFLYTNTKCNLFDTGSQFMLSPGISDPGLETGVHLQHLPDIRDSLFNMTLVIAQDHGHKPDKGYNIGVETVSRSPGPQSPVSGEPSRPSGSRARRPGNQFVWYPSWRPRLRAWARGRLRGASGAGLGETCLLLRR